VFIYTTVAALREPSPRLCDLPFNYNNRSTSANCDTILEVYEFVAANCLGFTLHPQTKALEEILAIYSSLKLYLQILATLLFIRPGSAHS
jgi:hypothetical protein